RRPGHLTRPSRHRTRGACAHWHAGCAVTAPAGSSAPQWPPARDRVRRSYACRLLSPSSEARLGSVSELQRHVLESEDRSGRAPRILLEVLDRDRVRVLGEVALGALGLGVDVGGVDTDADVLELGVALEPGHADLQVLRRGRLALAAGLDEDAHLAHRGLGDCRLAEVLERGVLD